MSLDLTPGTATDGSYTAYELLRQDGIVQSRQGSGTWVAGARPHHAVADAADALACAALGPPGRVIDLATLAAPLALRSVIDTLRAEDLDVLDAARKRKKAPSKKFRGAYGHTPDRCAPVKSARRSRIAAMVMASWI